MFACRRCWLGLVLIAACCTSSAATARAAEPRTILDAIPKEAGFALVVGDPRLLIRTILELRAVQDASALPAVREALDGTATRRAFQFLKFLERETGEQWPTLLNKVAGNGVALSIGYGPGGKTDATLLVLKGQDEAAVAKVFDLLVRAVEAERSRQGVTEPLKRTNHGGADGVEIDKEFLVARLGDTLFASNKSKSLQAAIDLANRKAGCESLNTLASIAEAKHLLPKNPLGWFWLDLTMLKSTKESKDFFEATRKDLFQTLLFGTTADCVRRADFVAGALAREKEGVRFAVRLPAGRDGFPPEFALHAPPQGKPGSLALLEPPGVLYSQSFYLDLATLWSQRDKLINAEVRKQFEKGEKDLAKVLPGLKIGEILNASGAYHRFVVVNLDKIPYTREPGQKLPGFGYAASTRDPTFGKSVEALIRGGGFLVSLSQGIKLIEQTHEGVKLFGYRFPEDRELADDEANIRFNFEPTFAIVDDQFIAGSTIEVAKKLVTEVRRTAKSSSTPQLWRAKAYAAAGAEALAAAPEATITDTMLRQAITLAEAKQQVEQLGDYLRTLGTFEMDLDEPATRWNFDLMWRFK